MAEPYGTIRKYRNAVAIKKHNKLMQPWASSLALQVASVFWATWKGIEERLPTGEEAVEAEKPVDSRNLKNKYSAIIRVEVNRHSEAMEEAIREHIYKVWLAGAVEQCRHLGCTSFFLSSLSRSSQTSESLDIPEMPSALSEATVKVDSSGWVSLPNYRAQEYAKKHAAEAVTQINDTTRKEIAKIVSDGVKNGTSYNDIAKAIKAKFEEFAVPKPQQHIPNRAVLVAVTELANAYCAGNMQVGNFLQDSGLKMMKAWQTLEDNRVSDGCRHNEAQGWIPLDKEFSSGHDHPPRFPGCRCDFLQEMYDEDAIGKSIDAGYEIMDKNAEKFSSTQGGKSRVDEYESFAPSWDTWELYRDEKLSRKEMTSFESGKSFDLPDSAEYFKRLLSDSEKSYDGIDKKFKTSLRKYTIDSFNPVNDYLRKGELDDRYASDGYTVKKVEKEIDNLKSAISERGVCTQDIVVHRGFSAKYWSDWNEGEIREIPEFLSTTVKGSKLYFLSKDGIAHIYVPANSGRGIYLNSNSKYKEECEYLIQAGSKFKVHHIEEKEENGRKITHFYLELVID